MEHIKARPIFVDHYKSIFLLLMPIYLFFYFNYPLYDIDTGWFAEPAYSWLNGGPMAMPSWPGVNGMDTHTYWFPPMIFWLQIPIYFLFGFGFIQDSLLLLFIFIGAIILTCSVAKMIYGKKTARITFLLLVSTPLYSLFALYGNRPDALVGIFNLIAIFFFFKSDKNEKYLYLCGVLGGLSVSSHMVGLLITPALSIVLVYQNRREIDTIIRKELKILIGFLAGILPWMMYASNDISLFTNQLYANTKGSFLLSFLAEGERISGMFLHKSMLLMTPILVLALYFAVKSKVRTNHIIVFVVLFHLLVLPFVSHKSPRYYLSVLPIWLILSARMMLSFFESKKENVRKIASAFFLIVFIFSLFSYTILFMRMAHTNNYSSINDYVSEKYLNASRDRAFLAQPAFFFIFKEKMYAYDAIFWRAQMYNDSLYQTMTLTHPDYIFYDAHMHIYSKDPKDGIAFEYKKFIQEETDEVEVICFVGKTPVESDKHIWRQDYSNLEIIAKILSDKDTCIDPITIYKIKKQTKYV